MSLPVEKNSSEIESDPSSKSSKSKKLKKNLPPPQPQTVEEALQSLGVSAEELRRSPPLSEMLKLTKGGLKAVLKAMRFALEDEDIAKFIAAYDMLPGDIAAKVPWEALCIAADVNPKHLLGAAHVALSTYFSNRSRILAVSNHPWIVKSRVKYARMAAGEKDRNALDIMVGALPSAKGPTFIGKAVFGGGSTAAANADDDDNEGEPEPVLIGSEDEVDMVFPPASSIQKSLVPIRNRLLEGGGKG